MISVYFRWICDQCGHEVESDGGECISMSINNAPIVPDGWQLIATRSAGMMNYEQRCAVCAEKVKGETLQ